MHYESGVGHIGGNLSALDALLHLHHRAMGTEDLFILSKGHAAGALYVTLWSRGLLSEEDLGEFHGEGTRMSGHPPPRGLAGIPVATGSLGHGLSVAAGMALGRRIQGQKGHVWCLMSDGEWQEGSCWEALIFARHRGLENFTVLVDLNGLQGFGSTAEVASMEDLAGRIRGFGLEVLEIDGHDPEALDRAVRPEAEVILLKTVKGNGVSFMENRMEWHYLALDEEHYARAREEVESA